MSEVEETIERIKVQAGVEGYVICNKQGQVCDQRIGLWLGLKHTRWRCNKQGET